MALSSERHDSTVNPDRGTHVEMESPPPKTGGKQLAEVVSLLPFSLFSDNSMELRLRLEEGGVGCWAMGGPGESPGRRLPPRAAGRR